MLETKCVGDNYKMLVTVLAIFVTKIPKSTPTLSHQHHCRQHKIFTYRIFYLGVFSQVEVNRNCNKCIRMITQ